MQITSTTSVSQFELINFLVAIVGLALAIAPLIASYRSARKMQDAALVHLQHLIGRRVTSPELMTGASIRGLAASIQDSMGCPRITDWMLIASIRRAALEVETRYIGQPRLSRLQNLNRALIEIDATTPRLLSIASHDPVVAYFVLALGISALIFTIQIGINSFGATTAVITLIAGLVLQIAMFMLAWRAKRAWMPRSQTLGAEDPQIVATHRGQLGRLDIFFNMSVSCARNVHIHWAPLWETLVFSALPMAIVVTVEYLISVISLFIAGQSLLDQPSAKGYWMFAKLFIFLAAAWLFSTMHQFRYFDHRRLRKRFAELDKLRLLADKGYGTIESSSIAALREVTKELWVLTGSQQYRKVYDSLSSGQVTIRSEA